MEQLSKSELDFILESLNYTKHAFEKYPIGTQGDPSYEDKQEKLLQVEGIIAKVRKIRNDTQN